MEIQIENQEDNEIEFKLKEESHGFSNLLLKNLQDKEDVKIAQYDIEHPKLEHPDFYIETTGKNPVEILEETAEQIKNQAEELEKQI